MTDEQGFPKTGDSQEIGQDAVACLFANKPRNWILKDLSGTDDYGFDYQVQTSENQQVLGIFRLQLKGTRSPKLNADGTYFSIQISASTLRLYNEISEPILLVLCDLSIDPGNPGKCPLYYVWVRSELRRVEIENIPLSQNEVTLRIPKENIITKDTDLLSTIKQANQLAKFGHVLDVRLADIRPEMAAQDRLAHIQGVETGISSRGVAMIDALAEPPRSQWINPARDTLAWHLLETNRILRTGNLTKCQSEIKAAEKLLANATDLETADYWFINGKIQSMEGKNLDARNSYANAFKANDQPKYRAAWAAAELRYRHTINTNDDYTDVIGKLPGNAPEILAIKARLEAASRRYSEAMAILDSLSGQESLAARAVIEAMYARPNESLQACIEGLTLSDLNDSCRQLFLLLKARARFTIAVGEKHFAIDEIIPPSGLPEMNIQLLKQTWVDIQEAVDAMRDFGWTTNAELIADIWSSTASILGKQTETWRSIVAVAKERPHLENLQNAAASIAAQCGEFATALEINARIPDSDTKILRRAAFLHELNRYRDCVDYIKENVSKIDRSHQLFGSVLTLAALSANELAETNLVQSWSDILANDPKLIEHHAILTYFLSTAANKIGSEDALRVLEAQYESTGHSLPIALTLFQEYDPTDITQATRCVEVATRVRQSSRLSDAAAVRLGMALVSLRKWDDLLLLSKESRTQFDGNSRLTAFEGLALDRLGRTNEARALLEQLLDGDISDSLALNTYINIMVRCGFVEEAIKASEKVLEVATETPQKIECIRLLFNLIQTSHPTSHRLIGLATQIGSLVDPKNEVQEGIFLTMFLIGTICDEASINEENRKKIQNRFQAFFEKFPDSTILKKIEISNNATGTETLRMLERTIGLTEERRQSCAKIENQLQRGELPIPYAWRPKHVLSSVHDIVHLWEIAKRSNADDKKYHLQMMLGSTWNPAPALSTRQRTPLLDMTALLVIFDLGLMDYLFAFFPKVAIGQKTLAELSRLTHPFSGSPWHHKCRELQNCLKTHFNQILQPSLGDDEDGEDSFNGVLEEIKKLSLLEEFQLYSDDIIFRIYCSGGSDNPPGICTGDFISALEETGNLSTVEAAEKFSTLCSWHVGVTILFEYQKAIIPRNLHSARSVADGVDLLQHSPQFMTMATAMWDVRADYFKGFGHAASLLKNLLEEKDLSTTTIASIVGVWYIKAKLRGDSSHLPIEIITNTVALAAAHSLPMDKDQCHRLWSVFNALIEFEHGNMMDEKKEREGVAFLAKCCADLDSENSIPGISNLRGRLALGLTSGTALSDWFESAYSTAMIDLGLRRS